MTNLDNLAIINLDTGEITPLDEWLREYRRQQLRLILAHLGNGRFPDDDEVNEAARRLFMPQGNQQ